MICYTATHVQKLILKSQTIRSEWVLSKTYSVLVRPGGETLLLSPVDDIFLFFHLLNHSGVPVIKKHTGFGVMS